MIARYAHAGEGGGSGLSYAKDLDEMLRGDPANLELTIFDAEARQTQQHVAARLRAAGLQKAQMLGRNAGIVRQLELSQASS